MYGSSLILSDILYYIFSQIKPFYTLNVLSIIGAIERSGNSATFSIQKLYVIQASNVITNIVQKYVPGHVDMVWYNRRKRLKRRK